MTIHCLHPLPTTVSPRLARLKDDEDGLKLTVNLMRVVVDEDEDEDEISTLVVDTILPGPIEGSNAPQARAIPRNDRQRQAFYSAVKDALKATILMACEWEGERFLWLP